EHQPIAFSDTLAAMLAGNSDIRHFQSFITKPGVIKTDSDFQGVVLKGVGTDYDWN
ncbi:MAG TPA: ABC transporter permease, partial [Porphyromonadaceae bacterium]|nr:ABC transporter permease [Porphyromonadaceae bacterium]